LLDRSGGAPAYIRRTAMNPRTHFLVATLLGVLLAGCASTVAVYPGARRSPNEVAQMPWDEAQRQIQVIAVDGKRIGGGHMDIEMLPGYRTIEVIYQPPKVAHSYPVQVTFRAVAGHRYALSVKMLHGEVNADGYWGGKYQVFVYDLMGTREVGRSPGPPPAVGERLSED
jgi:hypothetical protein